MSALPPPGCWSCDTVPPREDIDVRGVILPRRAEDGGPVTRFRCPGCAIETIVEPVPGGDAVLVPLEAAGLGPTRSEVLLGGRELRVRHRHAEAWLRQWAAALETLRQEQRFNAARAAAGRAPEAPPPPPKPKARRRPPPKPAPSPPATPEPQAKDDLPATPAEARRVLGVGARATRREIDHAFRTASRRCHPDLVAHLDPEFQALADRKFKRLKRAHELLGGAR